MPALPTSASFTGGSVTEGQFKASLTALRDYLSGLLGADGEKLQGIFVSLDPARDTPEKVRAFIRQFDDKMVGLTGTEEEIAAAAKGYAVVYNKVEGSAPDAYLMSHTQLAYLMGPDGKPIALVPTDAINTPENEGDPAKVKALLEQWVV